MPYGTEGPPAPPGFVKSDPIHHLYRSLQSRVDLDLDLKDHLLLVLQPYLERVDGQKDFETRAMLEAGLYCFMQRKLIAFDLDKAPAGSKKHSTLGAQYRAWVECFAKAYRLKGMKAPKKQQKEGRRLTGRITPAASTSEVVTEPAEANAQ